MRILFRTAAIWLLVWATFSQKSVIAGGGENLASVSVVINKNRSYTPDSTLKLVIGPGQFPVDFEKENKVSVAVSVPVKGTYGQLVNSFSTVTFFLMPGDDLTISLSNTYMTEGVYFYGKGADRARLCNTKDLAFKNYQINPDLDKMEPAVYMGYLRRMADANRKFIFSHDFDEYFLKCEAERMSIRLYGDYPRYPINHRNATQGKEIVMNEAYWKFIYDSLIVENESLAYLKEYNDMLKLALGMIAWKLDDNLEEVREQISLITSRFKHPYTLEQLVHFFVYDYVRKSGPEKIPEYMTLH
ncbi:MAG TPA: hypothetical protein VIK74_05875, partial [Parasegetibacter sp.]